jgi:hypothetical protein
LTEDARWPDYAGAAVKLMCTASCRPRYSAAKGAAALNLFGRKAHTFDNDAAALGGMLANHASAALSIADRQH